MTIFGAYINNTGMIKLTLEFRFYLDTSIRIELKNMSKNILNHDVDKILYKHHDGFDISTGYSFSYNKSELVLPSFIEIEKMDDTELKTYYTFISDRDRYHSIKRLYKSLIGFSQSRIFHYDNTGDVDFKDNGCILVT
jgi:hypothetical protein